MHETRLTLPACLRPTWGHMDRKGARHILLHPGGKALTVGFDVFSQLLHGPRDQWRGEDRQPQVASDGVGLRAVGGDANRRVRFLDRPGKNGKVLYARVLPLI